MIETALIVWALLILVVLLGIALARYIVQGRARR
jgi:hypothetical protein